MKRCHQRTVFCAGMFFAVAAVVGPAIRALGQESVAEPPAAGQRPPSGDEQPPPPPLVPSESDLAITAEVQKKLFLDPDVSAAEIQVSTLTGIVTLRGKVRDLLSGGRAALIARDTPGVASVINDLQVRHSDVPSDRTIRGDVLYALREAAVIQFRDVDIRVDSGVVYLSGTVESETMRDLANQVVRNVRGVQTVKNNLRLVSYAAVPDAEIRRDILNTLRREALLYPEAVRVEVRDGNVRFVGAVTSLEERATAVRAAWTAGAASVDVTPLVIAAPAAGEMIPWIVFASPIDQQIHTAVQRALIADNRLETFPIRADVTGQVVTLRGAVGSAQAKKIAGDLAARVTGVRDVVNRLEVRPPRRIVDQMMRDEFVSMLSRDPVLRLARIAASVTDGVVYLSGSVSSEAESKLAERLARRIPGVAGVRNNLTIQAPNTARRPAPTRR